MTNFNIITIGSCIRDIVFYTDQAEFIKNPKDDPTKVYLLGFEYGAKIKSDEIVYSFGGGAANTAVNFANLGMKTGIISCLGKDGVAVEIKKRLQQKKVNPAFLETSKKTPTGLSFLVVDKKSHEHFVLVSYGANNDLQVNEQLLKKVNTNWFYVSSLNVRNWPQIMNRLVKTKKKIAWNPGSTQLKAGYKFLKKYFSAIEVLLLNKDEAIELCLSAGLKMKNWSAANLAEIIWGFGANIVAVTDGANGAWICNDGKVYFNKPHHNKPKDTTGAGDCFGSTFVAGLMKTNYQIKQAMKLAIANTSSLVFTTGAQEGLLTWSQLIKKITK